MDQPESTPGPAPAVSPGAWQRPTPPPIPLHRRLSAGLHAAWPLLGWLGAVAAAIYLYRGPAATSEVYAYADVVDVGITPSIAGQIAAMPLPLGAEVHPGDVVLQLDTHDLEEQIALAKGDAERRPADGMTGRRVEVVPGRNGALARLAGAPVDEAQSVRLEMDRLEVEQRTDRGELQALGPEITRLRGLVEKHLATPDRLETLEVQQATLSKRVAARADEVKQLEARLQSWAADVSKAGQLYVTELEKQRAKFAVQAPVSGRIEAVLHQPGEWVAAGTVVAQILVHRPGRMTAYAGARQAPGVHVGTRASLRSRAHPSKVLGARVRALGPRIEEVPLRLRLIPTVVQWGQLVSLELDGPADITPGDIYTVRFEP